MLFVRLCSFKLINILDAVVPACQQYASTCPSSTYCEDLPSGGYNCSANRTTISIITNPTTAISCTTTNNEDFVNTVLFALIGMIFTAIVVALVIAAILVVLNVRVSHSEAPEPKQPHPLKPPPIYEDLTGQLGLRSDPSKQNNEFNV